jgi:hypothetical protein
MADSQLANLQNMRGLARDLAYHLAYHRRVRLEAVLGRRWRR